MSGFCFTPQQIHLYTSNVSHEYNTDNTNDVVMRLRSEEGAGPEKNLRELGR